MDPNKIQSRMVQQSNQQVSSVKYCHLSVDETADILQTNIDNGLDEREAKSRGERYGPNVMQQDEEESVLRKFLEQFLENPLILMLIASAVVSLLLSNADDAISITVAIIFVVGVGFIQEYRSEQSLKALNNLVPPGAHLLRDGKTHQVLAERLVPGDIVNLSVGDRVPADLRLVEAVHLQIDESALTGETKPVEKDTKPVEQNENGISDRANSAFLGTLITAGRGIGVVVGTGSDTEFGQIFAMMNDIEKPKTPLQNSMDKLGHQLSLISFGVIGLICIIGVIQGRGWLEMFQIGVSLAVAAIPEGLPIIVTVTLALGVLRMAKSNAIVRRLPSVETLGSVNVICTDKTGTLTMNRLHVANIWVPETSKWKDMPNKSQRHGSNGNGDMNGEVQNKDDVNGELERMMQIALYCNDSHLNNNEYVGNAVDVALMNMAIQSGLKDNRREHKRRNDVPFNSRRKWMAVSLDGKTYVKGAYEKLLPLCDNISQDLKDTVEQLSNEMASHGMRILALAQKEGIFDSEEDISGLTFCGMVAMYDPPRPGVAHAIKRLRESGVKIVMITGDNEVTAVAAAREVGIPVPSDYKNYLMLGSTLESRSESQLAQSVDSVLVFARTSPEMKVQIVRSLQARGDIVAMTGDGVNDAPALKLADIGIAMGSGTDVAKEAGDMILVNDNFSIVLQAIREGKAIYTNIKSFLTFQLSTSVAALSLIVVATLFRLPNPLNAMQVLWINILMDGPPAQSLGVEHADPEEMRKPPRKRSDDVLTPKLIRGILWRGAIILCGTMFVYVRCMSFDNGTDQLSSRSTTMSFTAFVLLDLFSALSCRSPRHSIFAVGIFSNKMFNIAVGLSLLGQLAVIYLPWFQRIFQTEPLSLRDMIYLAILASSVFWVSEVQKWWRLRRKPLLKTFV